MKILTVFFFSAVLFASNINCQTSVHQSNDVTAVNIVDESSTGVSSTVDFSTSDVNGGSPGNISSSGGNLNVDVTSGQSQDDATGVINTPSSYNTTNSSGSSETSIYDLPVSQIPIDTKNQDGLTLQQVVAALGISPAALQETSASFNDLTFAYRQFGANAVVNSNSTFTTNTTTTSPSLNTTSTITNSTVPLTNSTASITNGSISTNQTTVSNGSTGSAVNSTTTIRQSSTGSTNSTVSPLGTDASSSAASIVSVAALFAAVATAVAFF